ncbi:hypothetical protein [Albidovulum sp.]
MITRKSTNYARLYATRTEPKGSMFFQFECREGALEAWFSSEGVPLRPAIRDGELTAVALDMRAKDQHVITMLWMQRGRGDEFGQPTPLESVALKFVAAFSPDLKNAALAWKPDDFRKMITSANTLIVRVRGADGRDRVGYFDPRARGQLAGHLAGCAR